MQNIGKTGINSPGSTSQQERCKERPLQAAKNRRQARLNTKTKEQWPETVEQRTRRLDYHKKSYQHCFDFELVQDRDHRAHSARYNLRERFKRNKTEEERVHILKELTRNISLMI